MPVCHDDLLTDRKRRRVTGVLDPSRRRAAAGVGLAYLCGLVAFAAAAAWAGQDANWDLQNYHAYAPYALIHGRYALDVGPGGFQAYFNPLPYLVPYLLRTGLPPVLAALAVASLQAAVVPVTWTVAGRLPSLAGRPGLRGLATLTGCASATTISEIGTSFADLQLASLVLGGLAALLFADGRRSGWPLALAGCLLGAATGLKLTNGLYAAGFGAALLLPWRGWAGLVRAVIWAMTGFLAGLVLTDGAWAAYLLQSLGNPIFPALNNVFHSESAAPASFADPRFLPSGPARALLYPWLIATGAHPSAEIPFADARLAIGLPLLLLVFLSGRFRAGRVPVLDRSAERPLMRASAFLFGSYVAWLWLFSIERYAIAIEILAGLLLVAAAAGLIDRRARLVACLGLAAGILATTRPADWWHRPWTTPYRPSAPAALMQPAAVLVVSHPTGYWVPALPAASLFYSLVPVGLATGGVLHDRIVQGLANAPGDRVWTLGADVPMDEAVRASMAGFGYAPSAPCLRAASFWWVDTVFCQAKPAGQRRLAAATLSVGETVSFTAEGAGWIYEVTGFADAGTAGTATNGSVARLALYRDRPQSGAVLELHVIEPQASTAVNVTIDGSDAGRWEEPAAPGRTTRTLCLDAATGTDGVADITLTGKAGQPLGLILQTMTLRAARPGECQDRPPVRP